LKDSSFGYKTNYESSSNSLVLGLTHEYKSGGDIFINALSVKYFTYSVNTTLVELFGFDNPEEIDFTKSDFGFTNALRYRLTPTFLLKAAYAYDLRLPAENELLGDGYTITAAGNLKPERTHSLNLGAMFDASFSRDTRLQLEFNVFYYTIEDMIYLSPGINQFSYQNYGEIRGIGADFEIKYDMNQNIFMYANATYQDLRDTRKFTPGSSIPNPNYDLRMPNIPYFYANAGIEYQKQNLFGGTGQNSRLYLDGSFVEEYFYDFVQTGNNKRGIPQALSFDVGFEHSMYNDGFIITAQINNLTDENIISEFERPLPGRSFGVKFRYIFK
jgi:outer membrane receptor protein involved in Fe transport